MIPVHAKNREEFELSGILRFHAAGYYGRRGASFTCERFAIPPDLAYAVEALDTDLYPLPTSYGSHAELTARAFLEVAPLRRLYQVQELTPLQTGGKVTFNPRFLAWLAEVKPDTGFRSLKGSSGTDAAYADALAWCSLFNSAGNEGAEGYNRRIADEAWLGVGAVSYRDGAWVIEDYSSASACVDFAAPSHLYLLAGDAWGYRDGTSFSAPYLAGMAALVNDFFIDRTGSPLSSAAMYRFMLDHVADMGAAGKDVKTGWGRVVLPDPADIDIAKYAEGNMTIVMTIGSGVMTVNGEAVTLDQPPVIDKATGRTLVPVRALAEALGCAVDWDGGTQTITITK